jgi:hypothetical protein
VPAPQYINYIRDDKIVNCKDPDLKPGNYQANDSSKNDKWEIVQAKGVKKGMGRLNLNFPAGVHWSIDIYTGNKFIINRSVETYKLKYYDLLPGLYNIKLNTVMIENIQVEAGKTTTLRTGVLEINSNDWELRDETNKKFLTSGNKPKKMAVPVGKYQLQQGTDKRMVVVGELLPVLDPNVLETDQWVAKPIEGIRFTNLKPGSGRLNLDFGDSVQQGLLGFYVYQQGGGFQKNIYKHIKPEIPGPYTGIYTIKWSGVGISYENVKILKDYETSLKYGLYKVQTECTWQIDMNIDHNKR